MYELRVVALSEDARHVVLAPVLEGRRERYRVPVDDRLRAALRGELGRLERPSRPDSALTPREIQSRLRAGESTETIAAAAGVPVEWVLRFEAPVLAERALVASQARRSSLSVSGGEWTGVPLEEVVTARLERYGDTGAAEWDAWRREDGRWIVQVEAGSTVAQWLWDPALQRLVIHDDAARALLHDEPGERSGAEDRGTRRLALAPVLGAADDPDVEDEAGDPSAAAALDPALPGTDVAELGFPSEVSGPPGAPAAEGPADAVDRAAVEPAPPPATESTGNEPPAVDDGEEPRGAGRAARRARRKAVPSWEDILLGTGTGPGGGSG